MNHQITSQMKLKAAIIIVFYINYNYRSFNYSVLSKNIEDLLLFNQKPR